MGHDERERAPDEGSKSSSPSPTTHPGCSDSVEVLDDLGHEERREHENSDRRASFVPHLVRTADHLGRPIDLTLRVGWTIRESRSCFDTAA